MKRGLQFLLPPEVQDKDVSVIEVGPVEEQKLAEEINRFLGTKIQGLVRTDSYVLMHDREISGFESMLRGKPFVDPIIHRGTLEGALVHDLGIDFDYVLQSNLNPGTTDAFGNVALYHALLALGKKPGPGDSGFNSVQYFLKSSDITPEELDKVSKYLKNENLNQRNIFSRAEFEAGKTLRVPVVTLNLESKVETFDLLNMTDSELLDLSNKRRLAGSLQEMQQFRDEYKNLEFIRKRKELGLDEKATDVELETWFGLRSEHCFHKEFNARITLRDNSDDPIFKRAFEKGILTKDQNGNYVLENGLFKTFVEAPARTIYDKLEKRGKNWIGSMFEDNSGVVYYNEDYMICIKIETHNSPTNKEPVQGAKTGLDGVRRDGKGTMLGTFDLLSAFFLYGTGYPNYNGWLPRGVKHPYQLLKGATQGVREAGNETQIPTLFGGLVTDPRNIAKSHLYAGIVGFSRRRSPDGRSYEKKHAEVGDKIILIGQAVGIDGVHGATESSLNASADTSLGHVQADFSFMEAKVDDFILDYAKRFYFKDITDCGAMGIGSATHEMARVTGGLELDLNKHPKKYFGIQDFQTNCSETQNRMIGAVDSKDNPELKQGAELYEVPVTELGTLTDSGYIHLTHGNKTVALIDINHLFNKEPRKQMHATWNGSNESRNPKFKNKYSLEESLCMVMEQPDVASKEWFFRQKDSSVKGATIQSPLIGTDQMVDADATIQKPLETEGKDYGAIAYAFGYAPKLSDIDSYYSAQRSFIDMIGKIIAIGGSLPDMQNPKWDAWGVCGNYCQPNSDSTTTLTKESGEHNLASLVREGLAVREVIEATNIPIISGKDSMKCSCDYNLNLDEFMAASDTEFARRFMQLSPEVRKDLDKVKANLGELYDTRKIEEIVLAAIPKDLGKHMIFNERYVKKFDSEGKEYEVRQKAFEIHDPDSYLTTCAVKIDDYRKCIDQRFKEAGDLIYIIGTTRNELGSSQLTQAVGYREQETPYDGGNSSKADLEEFVRVCNGLSNTINKELVASCSYIHNGGILTALAKAGLAGIKGAYISPELVPKQGNFENIEEVLYSETSGRFIITVNPEDRHKFEQSIGNMPYQMIGTVSKDYKITSKNNNKTETISLDRVKSSYQKPLKFDLPENQMPNLANAI